MANFDVLKNFITQRVYTNGTQAITGKVMQDTLLEMLKAWGYQFQGFATPETVPPATANDYKPYYLANVQGTYTNFGGAVLDGSTLAMLYYDGSWKSQVLSIGGGGGTGNFVTLNTTQTITGQKFFSNEVGINNYNIAIYPEVSRSLGILYRKDPGASIYGGIGAQTTNSNEIEKLYMGWSSTPWGDSYNFCVSSSYIKYKNNTVWHAGNDGSGSGLDADMLDGRHLKNLFTSWADYSLNTENCYWLIDLTDVKYDRNTWYPCGFRVPIQYGLSRINVSWIFNFDSDTSPEWNASGNHYSCALEVRVQYAGWGTQSAYWYVPLYDYKYVKDNKSPLSAAYYTNSSYFVIYARGGGKYKVLTDFQMNEKQIWTTATSLSGQIISPTTTPSDLTTQIRGTIYSQYFKGTFRGNLEGNATSATSATSASTAAKLTTVRTIWGQSFNGTQNVTGAITGATTITASSNVSVGGTLTVTGASTLIGTLTLDTISSRAPYLTFSTQLYIGNATDTNNTVNQGSIRTIGGISAALSIWAGKNITASGEVTAISDIRTKSDIRSLTFRGACRPVSFIKDGKRGIGFIAQEVQKLYPELVVEGADGLLSLNYAGYTAVLQSQVDNHETELQRLRGRVEELERRMRN